MELSKLQQSIIDAPYNKIIVMSASASGKTRLLTEKVRRILKEGINPKKIAVITFTNMAASELRQRLGNDYKDGLFVGTIHGLANYFLLSKGINTGDLLNNEKFDELFSLVEENPNCIRQIDYLILDEAQDTDELQFKFLLEMINPPNFFICADLRQSIYQWRGARPDILEEVMRQKEVHVFDMNENYRNGRCILNFAKKIIASSGMTDTSIAIRETDGVVIENNYSDQIILQSIRKNPEYRKWAILTRTNKQLEQVLSLLKKNQIPCDSFRQGDLSKDGLEKKMEQNTVKVLTVHSAKGLEWNNVIVIGMVFWNKEERHVCYVAATRARDQLIWMPAPKKNKRGI